MNAAIAIGLTLTHKNPEGMVGWSTGQWGYHGDDGKFFISRQKGLEYGPIFSVGDVVGCGVLSDGTVYFTINGIFLGLPASAETKIPHFSNVYTTVSVMGNDARVRFVYNPSSFVYQPKEIFTAHQYLEDLPNKYARINLDVAQQVFGTDSLPILALLRDTLQIDPDVSATLIHALCIGNPSLFRDLTEHPLYLQLLDSKSSYAIELLRLVEKRIRQVPKLEHKQAITPVVIPASPVASSVPTSPIGIPVTTAAKVSNVSSGSPGISGKVSPVHTPNQQSPNQAYANPSEQAKSTFTLGNVVQGIWGLMGQPKNTERAQEAPSYPAASVGGLTGSGSYTTTSSISSAAPTEQQLTELVKKILVDGGQATTARINLWVCLSEDLEDIRDLVLTSDQMSIQGLTAALLEVFEELGFAEFSVKKIEKIAKVDTEIVRVRINTDKSVQMLKSNDKLIFYVQKK